MADPQRIADTTKAIHAIQNDGSLTPRTKNRLTQQMLTALATPAPAPAAAAPAPAAAAPAQLTRNQRLRTLLPKKV